MKSKLPSIVWLLFSFPVPSCAILLLNMFLLHRFPFMPTSFDCRATLLTAMLQEGNIVVDKQNNKYLIVESTGHDIKSLMFIFASVNWSEKIAFSSHGWEWRRDVIQMIIGTCTRTGIILKRDENKQEMPTIRF